MIGYDYIRRLIKKMLTFIPIEQICVYKYIKNFLFISVQEAIKIKVPNCDLTQ